MLLFYACLCSVPVAWLARCSRWHEYFDPVKGTSGGIGVKLIPFREFGEGERGLRCSDFVGAVARITKHHTPSGSSNQGGGVQLRFDQAASVLFIRPRDVCSRALHS
jgi:hypothetical protein